MGDYDYKYVNDFSAYRVLFDIIPISSNQWYNFICEKEKFSHLSNSEYYQSICLTFVSGLEYIKEHDILVIPDGFTYDYTRNYCEYLNYWLNDKLSKIQNSECDASQYYSIIKSNINKHFPDLEKCEGLIRNIKKDDIKNIEVLSNLYDNLNKYLNFSVFKNPNINPCDYANICVNLYDDNISQCNSDTSTSFCTEMLKFSEIYHLYMAKENMCHELKKILLHPQSVKECKTSSEDRCENHSDTLLSAEQVGHSYTASPESMPLALSGSPGNLAKSRVDEEGPKGDIVGPGGDTATVPSKLEEGKEELSETSSTLEGSTDDMKRRTLQGSFVEVTVPTFEDPDVSPSPDTPKTTAIALPALSALSLGFMLFKFTAIGPKVRNLFGKKRTSGMNSNQNITRELLEGAYKFNDNPDMTQGYIGYHAT
ncbi:PIR protein [Plasmodium vivax]|uniref:VIR protein n=1 Tax=Plasmodium vivax TaxID=5855 RepID=A0A565A4F1_PLAVI|nr:PIR protein [Plasmodium vivax]